METELAERLTAAIYELSELRPLERAAHAYHAAHRKVAAAQAAQDAAFKVQAKDQTYGNVQKWQDALAVSRSAQYAELNTIDLLHMAALAVPEVF